MAIAPNTTFVSGAVLTAAQMNALPWGIVSFVEKTTTTSTITTEAVMMTAPSFTAVASRYYRVSVIFPYNEIDTVTAAQIYAKIRKGTTTAGTQLNQTVNYLTATGNDDKFMYCQWTGTLTAGAQQMVATFQAQSAASVVCSATAPAQMVIEDMGPA
jgi:hypothetical protein